MADRKKFLLTSSINQGAIKILRKKKIDAERQYWHSLQINPV
jgi:hypothetical protein